MKTKLLMTFLLIVNFAYGQSAITHNVKPAVGNCDIKAGFEPVRRLDELATKIQNNPKVKLSLCNNISGFMSSGEFAALPPIEFEGTLNGNGYMISELTVQNGLFSKTREAKIRNLTVAYLVFESQGAKGMITAEMQGGLLENVIVGASEMKSQPASNHNYKSRFGGLVGIVVPAIPSAENNWSPKPARLRNVKVTDMEIEAEDHVGGLVGSVLGDIHVSGAVVEDTNLVAKENSATFNQHVSGRVGGMIGTLYAGQTTISDSYTHLVPVVSKNKSEGKAAGIVGEMDENASIYLSRVLIKEPGIFADTGSETLLAHGASTNENGDCVFATYDIYSTWSYPSFPIENFAELIGQQSFYQEETVPLCFDVNATGSAWAFPEDSVTYNFLPLHQFQLKWELN